MKIPAIQNAESYLIRLRLVQPFTTSFGKETHREALLIRLISNEEGWGECVASGTPFFNYETHQSAHHIIKSFLLPLLMKHIGHGIETWIDSIRRIRGHFMAKAALENALLDLIARQGKIPLYELIEGKPKKLHSGISLGLQHDMNVLLERIDEAVGKKYHRIKIKIKKGRDTEVLKTVRNAFPDIEMTADANADYTEADFDRIIKWDRFQLMMLEQPLHHDDLFQHARLQKMLSTPICLDESIRHFRDTKTAIELKSCKIINIKQGRVGGILEAKKIQAFCLKHGIPVWSGGMLETGIGRAFNMHLQTLPGFTLPGDLSETSRYFHEDIVEPVVECDDDGWIHMPEGNGIGVTVLKDRLQAVTLHYEKLY
jgi:O-succinylbenzoate synthase